MIIFPAIDIIEGKAVRLLRGKYEDMTVYSNNPINVALDMQSKGASYIHIVDLEGARDGGTPNFDSVKAIIKSTSLFVEVGGGIRNIDTVRKYIDAGAGRVILGTSALNDRNFLNSAICEFGDKIAVGADINNGFIAVKGWTETSDVTCKEFFGQMRDSGIRTLICTDISRDGAMQGTNRELYRNLSDEFDMNITASGGVSSLDDISALKEIGIYGAIIGKAYYTGDIDLRKAIEVAECL